MLLLLLACNGSAIKLSDDSATTPDDADSDTDADSDSDTDTDTDTDTVPDGPLPDVSAYMDPDATLCSAYYGEQRDGAKGYWWGSFTGNRSDGWDGRLHWQLYANATWLADGGADCEVVWSATGPSVPTSLCTDCTVSYQMTAFVDRARTTCPEAVYFYYQNLNYTYEIRLRDGGASDWYYQTYTMGAGYWAGDEVTDLNFLSAAGCVWL